MQENTGFDSEAPCPHSSANHPRADLTRHWKSEIGKFEHVLIRILYFSFYEGDYPGRRPVFRELGVSNSTVSDDVTLKTGPRMEFWLFPQMFWAESMNWNRSRYVPARAIQSGGQLKMSFQNF